MEFISVFALIISIVKTIFVWLNYGDCKRGRDTRTPITISNRIDLEEPTFFEYRCTLSSILHHQSLKLYKIIAPLQTHLSEI